MGSPFATAQKRCSQCLFPKTLFVDAETGHNVCRAQEVKAEIAWSERLQQLNALMAKFCDRPRYDAMMPFSGGNESTQNWYGNIRSKKFHQPARSSSDAVPQTSRSRGSADQVGG